MTSSEHRRADALLSEARAICQQLNALPALARIEELAARLTTLSDPLPAGLTAREVEVLQLMAAGLSNNEIADRLFISRNTVRVHVVHILDKIGVPNLAAATEFAIRSGIV
jgi:DNA-binding NarL/FixJ family response regulator